MSDDDTDMDRAYRLDAQIGFLLRLASQRHTGIFADRMFPDLTPTRFSAMAKLYEKGSLSQNELGRQTAMDISTIKGVVDRLRARGYVDTAQDPDDARRQRVRLTETGLDTIKRAIPIAAEISERTLEPLSQRDADTLQRLLKKLC